MSRLGGVEVKDRKDSSAGPFLAEAVDIDQERLVGSPRISAASAS
jgi:hypothetical protein